MQSFEWFWQNNKVFLTRKMRKITWNPKDPWTLLGIELQYLLLFGWILKAFGNHDLPVLANILNIVICKSFYNCCNTVKYWTAIFLFFLIFLYDKIITSLIHTEGYVELSQTSKIELFNY